MPSRLFEFRSISTRFIALTIIMVVILFGGLGVFIAAQNAKALRISLNSKSTSVADLASKTGAEYLENFNFIALDNLVEDIVKDPEVSFAGFYNNKKELVTKRPIPTGSHGLLIIERELKETGNVTIGTLKIGYKQDVVTKSLFRSISIVAAGTLLAIILFSLGVAVATKRLILTPINRICAVTSQVSSGDLSQNLEVTSNDELGSLTSSLNGMMLNLNQMVTQINTAAAELNNVTVDLSGTAKEVEDAAQVQADGISCTSSSILQMKTTIKGVTLSVDTLSHSATESSAAILEMTASVSEVALSTEGLNRFVTEISSSIAEMAASIKQVEGGVRLLQEVAGSTSSSVLEMDETIKMVEKNVTNAVAISDEVREDAKLGQSVVEASIVGILEIKRASDITSEVINSLSLRAKDIGAILSVIDDIAEQTNLLALNAAIIAAQAGEHGRGFAVVADEIKELSVRTRISTKEIIQVINGVQSETSRAVKAIDLAERSIAEGKDLSEKSGSALTKIFEGVRKSSDQMGQIARATVEQSKGSRMIRQAIEQVAEMVDQIAKATKEQSQGSELIMASAERMTMLTEQVRNSTQEQSKVGKSIARNTENITGMIANINRACQELSVGSNLISNAALDIQSSSTINIDSTRVMRQVIENLTKQVVVLKKEMSAFRV